MLKDYLRRLERLSWQKTATVPPTTQVAQPPKPQPPTQPPVAAPKPQVPPQGGFQPVAPPAQPQISTPQKEVDKAELVRQQREKEQADLAQTPMGKQMDQRAEMTKWVKEHKDVDAPPSDPSWYKDPATRQMFGDVIDGLINQSKLKINNKMLLHMKQHFIDNKKAADEAALGGGTQQDTQANPAGPAPKMDDKDNHLVSSFADQHGEFLQKLQGRIFRDVKDEGIANNVVSRLATEYLGPPRKAGLQDNRLAMLTRGELLKEFKNLPGFGDRLRADNIDQKVQQVLQVPQGKQRSAAINSILGPYLKESVPGAGDSIVDALTQMVSEQDLPPALSNFLSGSGSNLAKQEQAEKFKQDREGGAATLDTQVGDESSPSRGALMDANEVGKIRDMQVGEGEQDLMFARLHQIVGNKIEPVKQLSDTVLGDFYKYYNDKNVSPAVKIGNLEMSVPDIFQAIASAGAENVKKIIQPGNKKLKQQVFEQIEKNQAEDSGQAEEEDPDAENLDPGFKPEPKAKRQSKLPDSSDETSFSNRGGRVTLNMKGNSLNDMGISLRGLVQAPAIKPYLFQLGLAKEAIFRAAQANANPEAIAQQIQRELPQIQQKQQQELAAFATQFPKAGIDPATPWGLKITPDFVKNTLREATVSPGQGMTPHIDPNKASSLVQALKKSIHPGDKTATNAIGAMKHQWTKLYPFVFKTFEQSGATPDVRQLWSDIVGVHKRQYSPVSEQDVDRVRQVPQELWEGKKWWEHGIDQIGNRVFPETAKDFADYEGYLKYVSDQKKDAQKRYKDSPQLPQIEQQIMSDAAGMFPAIANAPPEIQQKFKERLTWEKRFNGVTKSENVRGIWQQLLGRPMPQHIADYLQWRDKTKVSRKSKNAEMEFLLRRYLLALNTYEQRLTKLAAVRNSLRKVGSTPTLDALISSTAQEAFDDLLNLSNLL